MTINNLNVKDRITKAKIKLQRNYPFWAYLSLFLKFKESEDLPDYAGMGVDERGNLYYKKEFVEKLDDKELVGVIAHEINHLVFLHLLRRNNKEPEIWNVACDIVVNSLLKKNNFILPKDCLNPDYNNIIEIFGKKIEKCDEKIAEEIYKEIEKEAKKQSKSMKGKCVCGKCKCPKDKNGKRKGDGKCKCGKCECGAFGDFFKGRFDKHFEGKNLSPKEKKELEKDWNGKIQEALTIAKMKGDTPVGLERLIGKLHEEKINWKVLLQRYITNQIPYNHSYQTYHKKSVATGVYMPNNIKERIEISVMVDLSGSIGKEELTDFMSEIIGMAKAFEDRIEMKVYSHDTECYEGGLIQNGNIEKIKKMELKGGGGTSFINPMNYFKENNIKPKCLIWLTDGYGDKIERQPFDILWVLSQGGNDDLLKDSGRVIKLDN